MCSTLETATIGLDGTGIPFVACEHLQECSDLPCDTGVSPAELQVSDRVQVFVVEGQHAETSSSAHTQHASRCALTLRMSTFIRLAHIEHVQERFPEVDFLGLPEKWYEKTGHYNFLTKFTSAEGQRLLWQRMETATEWLCSRSEETLVISAHHTVFNFLVGIEFRNCEVRIGEQGQGI